MLVTLAEGGALRQGWYVTEPSANSFPRLPVREGEQVLVGVALFPSEDDFERFQGSGRWADTVAPALSGWFGRPRQTHRLVPTARSALRA